MTDREREAIDRRLAAIVAIIFPASQMLGPDQVAKWTYEALIRLQADITASERDGVKAIEGGREAS